MNKKIGKNHFYIDKYFNMIKINNIRNFSIIAHIDHGKSTLADRLIQICGGLSTYEMAEHQQVLDSMDLERERGITIKARSVTLRYQAKDGNIYLLNFIDTPGHVDFYHEVSRALSACEGALLIVDATQGVEAQTLANCYAALEMNLKVIPIINKIDLKNANPDRVIKEIRAIIGINYDKYVYCSAKTGDGITKLLESIVHDIPPPQGKEDNPLQALIIDSWFDEYLGVVTLIRIKNGILHKGEKILMMNTKQIYTVNRLGIFTPKKNEKEVLKCGEVGWLTCSIKDITKTTVGDTITLASNPANKPLTGFKKVKPKTYAGLFPVNVQDYDAFHKALKKLSINDAALYYEAENSNVLGCGFRCGFLGLLHMEIIQQRLIREYKLDIITTIPTVIYELEKKTGEISYIDTPYKLPELNKIRSLREPIATCCIFVPQKYLGNIISFCIEKRGIPINMIFHPNQVELIYEIPMNELVINFFDRLKSLSQGYATFDYKFNRFKKSDVVKLDILINKAPIDALALIIHRNNVKHQAHKLVEKIKEMIPRQQFEINIQAAIGNIVIARATIKQLRKNVIDKCYGGDVSRKKKLLQKQKKGKKRMKNLGKINIPREAFLAFLNINK